MAEDVYCTLLMSDSYLPGAAVLARSLRDCGTKKKLAVLVTIESLLASTVAELKALFDYIIPVERIANASLENLARLDRLDLRFAFTKIGLWRQEQFRKILYVDADVVALRAPDELFNVDANFAAAPDIGWPDIFNTGVMLLKPSMSEYASMRTLAASGASFDGADQGLLNEYFGNRPWERLSFAYNCTPNAGYQYEPAYRYFRSSISMVHFIGKEKPWTRGREALSAGGSGVYKELLGSWWAVYDRHYKSRQSSALGQIAPGVRTIQHHVKGEQPRRTSITWATDVKHPFSAPQQPVAASVAQVESFDTRQPPEASGVTTELPMTEHSQEAENLEHGIAQSVPIVEQRTFSAPQMDWDATRSEPPIESKPEASNFPSQRYEMSHDPGLFRAPVSYPEPPKEALYEAPKPKPTVFEKPKPIFPWEGIAKKATRVFADDLPEPEPTPALPDSDEPKSIGELAESPLPTSTTIESPTISRTAVPRAPHGDPWQSFTRTNAWDEDATIDQYVRALKLAQQQRRGQVQVIHQAEPPIASTDFAIGTPTSPPVARRRESLILTDFPTEIERPSLPVTPAPIQRQTFWGDERDDDGNLPPAEGVPEQVDWNPVERLEELRRTSIIATGEMPLNLQRTLPDREMPETSRSFGSSPPVSPGALATGVPQSLSSRIASGQPLSPTHSSSSDHTTAAHSSSSGQVAAAQLSSSGHTTASHSSSSGHTTASHSSSSGHTTASHSSSSGHTTGSHSLSLGHSTGAHSLSLGHSTGVHSSSQGHTTAGHSSSSGHVNAAQQSASLQASSALSASQSHNISTTHSFSSMAASSFTQGHSTFTADRLDPDVAPAHHTFHEPELESSTEIAQSGDESSTSATQQSTTTTGGLSLQIMTDESSSMDEYSIA